MRILRLEIGQGHYALDLHPFVTIVSGLSGTAQQEVLEAIRRLARGSATGIRGMLQHQGLLVELDGQGNEPRLAPTAANVVVDLGIDDDRGSVGLAAHVEQYRRQAEIDAVVLEEIRADLNMEARARVAEIQALLLPLDSDAMQERIEARARLEERLDALDHLPAVVAETMPGIPDLRNRLAAHEARAREFSGRFDAMTAALAEAEAALDQARTRNAAAQEAAVPVLLTREEEARLEQLAFPEMDDTRRGKWRKVLQPEEEAEMAALLERVGVESWTAYTMYRTDPVAPQERRNAAAAAEREVELGELAVAEARDALANDEVLGRLESELEAIRMEATEYLGPVLPNDLAEALAELHNEVPNPEWLAAGEELLRVMDQMKLTAPTPPPGANVVGAVETARDAARAWLDNTDREEGPDPKLLERELNKAQAQLDRHRRALARIGRAETAAGLSVSRLAHLEEQVALRNDGDSASIEAVSALVGSVAARVESDAGGSLPIAVLGQFVGMASGDLHRLLDHFNELTEAVQVIVITDREEARAWADAAGLERAFHSTMKAFAPTAS